MPKFVVWNPNKFFFFKSICELNFKSVEIHLIYEKMIVESPRDVVPINLLALFKLFAESQRRRTFVSDFLVTLFLLQVNVRLSFAHHISSFLM